MRTVTLEKLVCRDTEDWFGSDECRVDLYSDGVFKTTLRKSLNNDQTWNLNKSFVFENEFVVKLWDEDSPRAGDPNDFLGRVGIGTGLTSSKEAVIKRSGVDYRLIYSVVPEKPTFEGIIDRTGEHQPIRGKVNLSKSPRDPGSITTIMLHQTGAKMSTNMSSWDKVACHAGVMSNGTVLYINPLTTYVNHGNGANRFSLGMEIHGLLPGLKDNLKSMPPARQNKPPAPQMSFHERQLKSFNARSKVTPEIVEGARQALRFLVEQGRREGMPIERIIAHRQSWGKPADPGEELWKEVGLWGAREFGLIIDPHYKIGRGRSLPQEWGVKSDFNYRGRKVTP